MERKENNVGKETKIESEVERQGRFEPSAKVFWGRRNGAIDFTYELVGKMFNHSVRYSGEKIHRAL